MKFLVAGTGHRPDKLGGWDNEVAYRRLVVFARDHVLKNGENGVVSGMAAGWDLALAEGAIEASIPVLAAIPFSGQEKRWSKFWQERYHYVLDNAHRVNILFEPNPNDKHAIVQALHGRNDWMVNYIHEKMGQIYALWNGSRGGTAACIRSAQRQGVRVVNYWDKYTFICSPNSS